VSVNEADLPTSRRFNATTTVPHAYTSSPTTISTELPDGSRRFNATVAFPQSHVTTGQAETIEFVSGPKGDPGPPGADSTVPGPPGTPALWDSMTLTEYQALLTRDPNTLYVIVP
jgi:hypothetical protein